jgi:phage shock protein A
MTDTEITSTTPSLEQFVTGRLTLVTLRNELETQLAGLRSQLVLVESQLHQTEELLRRADEKLAAQHPEAYASLTDTAAPHRKR